MKCVEEEEYIIEIHCATLASDSGRVYFNEKSTHYNLPRAINARLVNDSQGCPDDGTAAPPHSRCPVDLY